MFMPEPHAIAVMALTLLALYLFSRESIAIETSSLPPEPFVLAVMFGVNMGYATPMADNCNLLVYSAGGYVFRDFVRVGVPLTIIMWLAFSWILPQFYPLH